MNRVIRSADVALGSAGRAGAAAATVEGAGGIQAENGRYAGLDRADRPALLAVTANGALGPDVFSLEPALTAGGGAGAFCNLEQLEGITATRSVNAEGPRVLFRFFCRWYCIRFFLRRCKGHGRATDLDVDVSRLVHARPAHLDVQHIHDAGHFAYPVKKEP